MGIILLILFLFSFSYAEKITTCYTGYYMILPLVEDCITYENGKISASAKSTPLGSLFKTVSYKGYSIYEINKNLESKIFHFVQVEGSHKWIHNYKFTDKYIFFQKKEYKLYGKEYKFKKETIKKIENKGYLDPFTSSIYLYNNVFNKKNGILKIFYDGKGYFVPYKVLKKENLKILKKNYSCIKVLINPDFKTKGLLRPTGNWYIWVDKDLKIPVKMELDFTIGSFKLILNKITREEKNGNKKVN